MHCIRNTLASPHCDCDPPHCFHTKSYLCLFGRRIFILFTVLMMVIAYVNEENAELTVPANGHANHAMNGVAAAAQTNGTATDTKTILNPPDVILGCKTLPSAPSEKSFSEKFVKCFSVRDNFRAVMSTHKPPNAIPVIDGLKLVCGASSTRHSEQRIMNSFIPFVAQQIDRMLPDFDFPHELVHPLHRAQSSHDVCLWRDATMALG